MATKCKSPNYIHVPNLHVAIYYQQDLRNYSMLRNTAVMIEEQKHKIFKLHAPHTNSCVTEL